MAVWKHSCLDCPSSWTSHPNLLTSLTRFTTVSPAGDGTPKYIYFLAIIDVLTHYGMKKQATKAAKTVKYGSGVEGISTVGPEVYGRRFLDFMQQAIA